jgi:hypothetical protein
MDLNVEARLLRRIMSDLSEEYLCAQWPVGNEYKLWGDLAGESVCGEKPYGISPEEKEELHIAHELAGGWLRWSEEAGEIVFLTTEEWLAHLAQAKTLAGIADAGFVQ